MINNAKFTNSWHLKWNIEILIYYVGWLVQCFISQNVVIRSLCYVVFGLNFHLNMSGYFLHFQKVLNDFNHSSSHLIHNKELWFKFLLCCGRFGWTLQRINLKIIRIFHTNYWCTYSRVSHLKFEIWNWKSILLYISYIYISYIGTP